MGRAEEQRLGVEEGSESVGGRTGQSREEELSLLVSSASAYGASFSDPLIAWYEENRRDLPWRDNPDPYKVWISEIMLQQTRVSQSLEYYLRFVDRFPTVESLASAPEDDVLKVWQGLGYYARARNLQRAARLVVDEHGGSLPQSYDELIRLPGFGDYTASAVACFAFGEPRAAVDGNVHRILSRCFGLEERFERQSEKRLYRDLANALLDRRRPRQFNQAMMDLGATVCMRRGYRCEACPLQALCYALKHKVQNDLPPVRTRSALRDRYLHFFILGHGGATFMQKRQGRDIWKSLYQFPLVETEKRMSTRRLLKLPEVRAILGESWALEHVSEEIVQDLSHQRLYARFYVIRLQGTLAGTLSTDYETVPVSEVNRYQVPVMLARYVAEAEPGQYLRGGSGTLEEEE